ncbi:integral membrane sensor signal transduction histidine kinase [Paenibacillus mucilaginosus 3016]|uniref:histidine kinase n=1 Tax=Paenibacillus mucilaginosus 3016 TaxID=1116391 RepID=H6NK15_9BACL|nr:sensor histidine kinase [Paenibacillus mucilaginosus]AFC30868.1 integral membrane sensor signal transduction histidine kinase [Paenibacillus mucilaginosus 3016]WFA19470.1 sensor histidine kinase [Paenibacillus mucilaginosus]
MPVYRMITTIINNIEIRKKLTLSYLLVVFLPVLTVGMLLTQSLKEQSVEHAVEQSLNNAEKIKKQVEETLKLALNVSFNFYFDNKLIAIADKQYEDGLEVYQAYSEYDEFTKYMELYKEISGIRFYTENQTLLENWSFFILNEEVRSAAWVQQVMKNRGRVVWTLVPDPTKANEKHFSLVRQIFRSDMKFSGILVIAIHSQKLNSIISQEPYETLILTEENEVVASKDPSLLGKVFQGQSQEVAGDGRTVVKDTVYDGKPVKMIVQPITLENSDNALRVVSIVPLDTILLEANQVSIIAYSIMACSLVLAVFLILYFSGALSSRIGTLIKDIREVASGDFTLRSVIQGKDEIGQLSLHFNYMVKSIENLVLQVNEAVQQRHELELREKEMKFKMLANQVNPHFLFNVLETVRMKAHVQGEEDIANIVKSLGRLLRHNLEIGQEEISLASEMDIVRMYLEIQHFRFGDKLTFLLPDQEETEGMIILPMVLQPIVENAIVHGIEKKMGRGVVQIKIVREESCLNIEVRDNGIGMRAERVEDIARTLEEPFEESGQRIGLINVHQRLRLQYGAPYGLEVASEENKGTVIRIRIPIGGEDHV